MEIRGDDPFRLRSYRNAAKAIEVWPTPLKEIIDAEGIAGLQTIPGVGKAIAGLGDRFLRHLDRTRLLVHLLDASSGEPGRTPLGDYEAMNKELALYDPALAARPQLVVLNKIDLPDVRKGTKQIARQFARRGIALTAISAATGEGTAELLELIWRTLPPRSQST
jgi:GTPase involved in cell partitioning and DNA repair